jgi:phenylacetate-CoA ligase
LDDRRFHDELLFLKESQFWPRERLEELQLRRLRRLLGNAGTHVPFYRNHFRKQGFEPSDLRRLEDLRGLPTLTKETILEHHRDFLAENVARDSLVYMTTGGSTGNPLKIWMDSRYKACARATTWFHMSVAGFEPGTVSSVRLHGDILPTELVGRGIFWQEAPEDPGKLVMSSYHIDSGTAAEFVNRINQHRPRYLHAFSSAVSLLAGYVEELGLDLDLELSAVFTDSEVLYTEQRTRLERVFGCPVYSTYGHTEGSVLGITTPGSRHIHLVPQVGIAELLDEEGKPVTEPGQRGEIVVTGFYNHVFPFIRYRTRDIGILASMDGHEHNGGRHFVSLKDVEGRVQDYAVDRTGRAVPLAPALFDYNFDWSGIDRFQVYQNRPGRLVFRLVPSSTATEPFSALEERVKTGFHRILNGDFQMEVERWETIPHTHRGKYRYMIQEIDMTETHEIAGILSGGIEDAA